MGSPARRVTWMETTVPLFTRSWPPVAGDRRSLFFEECAQHLADAIDAVHDDVGLGGDLRRALLASNADAQDLLQGSFFAQYYQLPEGVEVGGIVPDEHGPLGPVLLDEGADGGALVRPDGGACLDDPAPDRDPQSQPLTLTPHELHRALADLRRRVAVVDGGGDALVLHERAQRTELLPRPLFQLLHLLLIRQGVRGHLHLAITQDLEAVVAEIDDVREPDEFERVLRLAAADARHEKIPLAQAPQ